MIIETLFSIGQAAYYATVGRETQDIACSRCSGRGELLTTDVLGEEHRVPCPSMRLGFDDPYRCRSGRVIVGLRHVCRIRELTVGQVRVTVGGLSGNSNMGDPGQQTREQAEEVMCYETGIGSGSIYSVKPRVSDQGAVGTFASREEAEQWGAVTEGVLNSKLKMELIHEAALCSVAPQ